MDADGARGIYPCECPVGLRRIDEAIVEYETVLSLEPGNVTAEAAIREIQPGPH